MAKSKIWLLMPFATPLFFIILIVIIIASAGTGQQNVLAASATTSDKAIELLHLKPYGIPYDIVMMLSTYPCKTQEEAEKARFIFIAMDFANVEEEVSEFVCICPEPEPTPEDPDPEFECTCDNWEVTGSNYYSGKNNILAYLKITESEEIINCINFKDYINNAAAVKESSSTKYAIKGITSVPADKTESIIKNNGVTRNEDVKGILELHEAGYFLKWLEELMPEFGGSGIPPEFMGKYSMPVAGPITSSYGWRSHPITGKSHFHTGIDIGSAHYDDIVSVADGVVIGTGTDKYNGRYIIVYHENEDVPFYSYYGHLSAWVAGEGQAVGAGQKIAVEGGQPDVDPDVGYSTGHHLHFEIWLNNSSGSHTNPLNFLSGT